MRSTWGNYSSDLFEGQGYVAPIMADWIGLTPKPATRIEDACASSGVALRQGILGIASGIYDVVLVGGMEKMTNLPTEQATHAHQGRPSALHRFRQRGIKYCSNGLLGLAAHAGERGNR